MVKSFKHKGLSEVFATGTSRKVQPKHVKKLGVILGAMNAASQVGQLRLPGLRLHQLAGGRYSVWVDENYRVTFGFQNGHAYEVDYEDYH